MLELPGQAALSDFRLAKLTRSLQRADKRVEAVEARFAYFVATHTAPGAEDKRRLDALLLSGDKPAKLTRGAKRLYVVPRPGTISPWSSKATDIVKACNIESVDRVERGICYGIRFKGKADDVDIFEVIWQTDDVTRMTSGLLKNDVSKTARLSLSYDGRSVDFDAEMPVMILGRGAKADMVINDSMASREHARIECRRGKFILTDMSTNGTYVLTSDGPSYLRREDMVLIGEGKIALGRDLNEATEVLLFNATA